MALSGSKTIDATPNSCDLLVFSWEATQDRKTNSSTINWTMKLVASEDYGLIYGAYPERDWTVTIDGVETTGTADINIDYGETKTLATGSTVVEHDSDGTKTFDYSFSLHVDISGWGAKETTETCPECNGDTIDIETGEVCGACEGTGEITTTTAGTTIDWVTGTDTVELDPIAKLYDILGYINGYIMSICGGARRMPTAPVAYLYNGVRLPALPEWDKEAYPYAVMNNNGSETIFSIHLCSTMPYLKKPLTGHTFLYTTGAYMYATYNAKRYGDDWYSSDNGSGAYTQANTEDGNSGLICNINFVMWANCDVYDADGNVVCEASDPVPVYE